LRSFPVGDQVIGVYETFLDSIQPTVVFASYWRYAVERQQIYLKRLKGERQPWTVDPVLRDHRFTNVFRASDRVSQFCIKNVIYQPGTNRNGAEEVVFRISYSNYSIRSQLGWLFKWDCMNRRLGKASMLFATAKF
jgi:alpha-glutamyl/putrescinyl thymine pyrophosphorylase clade 1